MVGTLYEIFPRDEALDDVRAIETVHAVGPENSFLIKHDRATSGLLAEKSESKTHFKIYSVRLGD